MNLTHTKPQFIYILRPGKDDRRFGFYCDIQPKLEDKQFMEKNKHILL